MLKLIAISIIKGGTGKIIMRTSDSIKTPTITSLIGGIANCCCGEAITTSPLFALTAQALPIVLKSVYQFDLPAFQ